ncbi:MAG: hypothetical protein WAW37_07825 [Syntrophobacteraceae bacterium]
MEDVRSLCRRMVERCNEYVSLMNAPDQEMEAAALKADIMRLYREISTRIRR